MRSPDLMKYMGKGKQSSYFIKKDTINQDKKDTLDNSFINLEEEQATIDKTKNKFSAAQLIHNFTRTPKNFIQTQKVSTMYRRFSPKIKSTKILPNLPQKDKLTQSFYEIPMTQNSMIIDRSHDWGYRNNPQNTQMNYVQPNRQVIYPVYSQRNVNYKYNQNQVFSKNNINHDPVGMKDVTNNYANYNQTCHNQFVRIDSQPVNQSNNANFVGGFGKNTNQFSLEDMESNLVLLFKKILVFSSKIDSLKVKIMKRNPEFSIISIFQTFCDLKTRRIDLQGIKEFTQTFGFEFSSYYLERIFIYLSGYRIQQILIGMFYF